MGDFPWQKGGHRDDTFRWDRRMPWQRDGEPSPSEHGDEAEAASDVSVSEATSPEETSPERLSPEAGSPEELFSEKISPAPTSGSETGGEKAGIQDTTARPSTGRSAPATEQPAATPSTPEPSSEPERNPFLRPAAPHGSSRAPRTARPAKRGFRIAAWTVGGAVALPVIFGVIGSAIGDGDDNGGDREAAPEVPQQEIAQITRDFFAAVSDADLDEAMARLDVDHEADGDYESHALLTQEVLDGISQRAPISDISIGEVSPDPEHDWRATVEVGYRLGDGPHTVHEIEVYESAWATTDWAIAPVNFSQWLSPETLPTELQIEGVSIDEENRYVLLPGLYEFDTGSDRTTLWAADENGDQVLFEDRLLAIPGAWEAIVGTEITEEGRRQVIAAVDASLDACVAEDTLETACGSLDANAFGGGIPIDGTLRRELTYDVGAEAVVSLHFDDPSTAIAYRSVTIGTTARCADGDDEVECVADELLERAVIDVSDPDLRVRWESDAP